MTFRIGLGAGLVAGVLAASAFGLLGADEGTAGAAERAEAARVFCGYIDARNRHDVAAASALTADDIRWIDADGRNHPKNDRRLATMLAWEGGMNGRWTCRVVGFADGWLEAEVSEENRMYDALGVGAIFQRDRVRVAGGKIREGRTLSEWSTGRGEDEAFDDFKKWLASLPEDRRVGLLADGSLVYDGETAKRERPLLDEWENAHPPPRKLLAETLEPLGGAERVGKLDGWVVEGKGSENLSAELQGLSPAEPTWRPHEEKVAVVRASGSVAWQRKTPRDDFSLRWRRFVYEPNAFGVVDFVAGYGVKRPRETPDADRQAMARRIPHLLLLEAATTARRLVASGERTRDGGTYDAIDATLSDDSRLTLLLSRSRPRALAGAEYAAYLPGLGDSVVAWTWSGWKRDPGVGLAPSGHRVTVNGAVFQEVTYDRYSAGNRDAAEMMEMPADLPRRSGASVRVPVPAAGPATGEVAPGVHVAEVRGFFVPFFELADFVVLFDAPAAAPGLEAIPAAGRADCERVTEELLATIARTCPGKPVRFVVLSHHHSDHLGGLRAFAARGVTILAAPGHVPAVRRALTAPHALAPDRWSDGADGRDLSVEAVPDRRVVGDGRRRIEIVNVGANPHTAENLFAWLPQERLLFQGDLFYYEEGEPFPPSGRETMNRFFAGWLSAHGLFPKAVYGIHSSGAAPQEALRLAAH